MATDLPPQPDQAERPPMTNGVAGKAANAAATNESSSSKPAAKTADAAPAPTLNGNGGSDPGSLRRVSLDAQRKVAAFLVEEPATEQLRALQGQVRISLGVIEKALDDYRYARGFADF